MYRFCARGNKRRRLAVKTPSPKKQVKDAEADVEEAEADVKEAEAEDAEADVKYSLMYYKNHRSWGIRRKGGPQIVSVAKSKAVPEELERLAKKALNSLNQGYDEEFVKILVKVKVARLPLRT